ncbi:MAG TPA: LamG domain-containing protein [Baekduia sp.]|nr:LamG domain-containing protein [Baekduia sp.]
MLVPTFLVAGSASAATVPLNGRTFNDACNAASAGDTITVPSGSYGTQTISCQKAVTFLGTSSPTVAYVAFSSANGPTVDGFTLTGGMESKFSKNIAVRNSKIYNLSYIEGTTDLLMDHNVHTNAPGGTTWSNGDMLDIYEQTNRPINERITIQDSVFHGLRAPTSTSHPDAIQLCNCAAAGDSQYPKTIKILRNKFYDNECMNLRANPKDDLLLEGNVFGDSVTGISGCGYYSLDVYYASAAVRYNTFVGSQEIQVNPSSDVGQSQSWVGNAGIGMSSSCGAIRASYSHNVWTQQKCGTTDAQVSSLKINSDGTAQTGSPLIDAGDKALFPATDFNGMTRYAGAGPDAGAFESGAGTTPPPPPADTTAPDTTITSAPASGTSTSASVAFSASESGSTFACKLDAGTYAACTSPKALSGLAAGSHTFSVRATDAAGNVDASPATATWSVTTTTPPADTTAPTTSITSVPVSGTSTSASLVFSASESGSTFACRLDGGTWAACTSPTALSGLAVGTHTFEVRATDAAGNVDASPALVTWTVNAATPAPTPTTGLVAAYGFNETAGTTVSDATGHGLTGTRSGTTTSSYGKFGGALSFDGDHDNVTIADNSLLDLTTGMTLEAWVRPTSTSGWRTIMTKEQSGGLTYGLYASSDTGKPTADVFTTSELITRGPSALPTYTWSHVAATYNGSSLVLYVNGNVVATKAVTGSMVTSSGALRIGGTSVWGEWFSGKIDEVRVYNKTLTATQIQADMTKAV